MPALEWPLCRDECEFRRSSFVLRIWAPEPVGTVISHHQAVAQPAVQDVNFRGGREAFSSPAHIGVIIPFGPVRPEHCNGGKSVVRGVNFRGGRGTFSSPTHIGGTRLGRFRCGIFLRSQNARAFRRRIFFFFFCGRDTLARPAGGYLDGSNMLGRSIMGYFCRRDVVVGFVGLHLVGGIRRRFYPRILIP